MKKLIYSVFSGSIALMSFHAHGFEPEECVSLLNEKLVAGDASYSPTSEIRLTGVSPTTKPNGAILLIGSEHHPYPSPPENSVNLIGASLAIDGSRTYAKGTYKEMQVEGGEWSALSDLYIHFPTGRVWSYSHIWRNGWKEWRNISCYRSESNISERMIIRGERDYGRGVDFYTLTLQGIAPLI